jgi:hypothetical protein
LLALGAPDAVFGAAARWWSDVIEALWADGWEFDPDRGSMSPVPSHRTGEEASGV